MPFTLAHPAAVLPLLRVGLPASALVAGSVAPDVPLYLPPGFPWPTHTAQALLTVDLLLAGLLWTAWHGVLAAPALAAAPAWLRQRLARTTRIGLRSRLTGPRDVAAVVLALLVGATTHVVWDEFTHPRRWGTEHLPVLAQTWAGLPGYRWAQDVGSALGLLVLLLWLLRWARRTPPRPGLGTGRPWPAWVAIAVVGLAVGTAAALRRDDLRSGAVVLAARGGGAAAVTAVCLALAWHASRSVHRREQRAPR
jgi:hypothetical protein